MHAHNQHFKIDIIVYMPYYNAELMIKISHMHIKPETSNCFFSLFCSRKNGEEDFVQVWQRPI